MQLKLQVTNGLRQSLGKNFEHVFDSNGGTIGRAPHNDWVLPDPKRFVSSVHASIEARDGGFYLVDTSMNGVYVNGSRTPLGPTAPHQLTDGTRLRMGNYRIAVSEVQSHLDNDQQTLLRGDFFEDKLTEEPSAEFSVELLVEDDIAEQLDLESLLDDRMASANTSLLSNTAFSGGSSKSTKDDAYSGTDNSQTDSTQPHTATVHRLPGVQRATDRLGPPVGGTSYAALLEGLGLQPDALAARQPEDIARAIGEALRASLQGMQAMKSARARSKQQLALAPTQQDVDDLTPTNIDDDIADLLLGRGQIYQRPADNITADARSLMQHQMAFQNATQASLSEFFDQLEPDELTHKLQEHGGGKGLFTASRKASLWDQYCRYYAVISQRADNELPEFIRDEFARAYQARLRTLESSNGDE
ncbi:MAG: type VI secretion system-associated FHA domain protein TagH [Pseudomonadota bacterium]